MSKWLSVIFAGGLVAILGGIFHEQTEGYYWPIVLVSAVIICIGIGGLYKARRRSSTPDS